MKPGVIVQLGVIGPALSGTNVVTFNVADLNGYVPLPDTSQPDTSQPDTSQPDTGQPDTGQPNPGQPDTGQPNPGQPDPGQPDPGQPGPGDPVQPPTTTPVKPPLALPLTGRILPDAATYGVQTDKNNDDVRVLRPNLIQHIHDNGVGITAKGYAANNVTGTTTLFFDDVVNHELVIMIEPIMPPVGSPAHAGDHSTEGVILQVSIDTPDEILHGTPVWKSYYDITNFGFIGAKFERNTNLPYVHVFVPEHPITAVRLLCTAEDVQYNLRTLKRV